MKTPEQIADDVLDNVYGVDRMPGPAIVRQLMAKAIEADRAQREITLAAEGTRVHFTIESGFTFEAEGQSTVVIDATRADLLAAIGQVDGAGMELLHAGGDPDRTCKECEDEVATLSTDGLCDGCVEYFETTTICPNCGERVDNDEMNHWPNLKEPISMCDSCEYNARRCGWEPGQ